MKNFYSFLDNKIFPFVVSFFANPIVILVTLLLLIPMIGWQNDVILILLLNSYMNVGSFGTSQITLRQVILTSEQQEKRAQETHDTVMQSHMDILLELESAKQERQEIAELATATQQIHQLVLEEMAEVRKVIAKGGGENESGK